MPIVRNRDNGLLYDFDPETGELQRLALERVRPSAIVGQCGRVASRDAILWSDGRELTLRLEGRDFEIEPALVVEALDSGGIRLVRAGFELQRVPYRRTLRANEPPNRDFGIYLVELLANPAHRDSLLQNDARTFLLRGHNLLEETLAIVAEQLPDRLEGMADEIRRWCWRWDDPEGVPPQLPMHIALRLTYCPMCGFRATSRPEFLCGPCTELTRRLIRSLLVGADAQTEITLIDATRAVRAAGLPHSEFLATELSRRATLATPRLLPPGSECDVCGPSERRVLRGVAARLCTGCVVRRGARIDP